MLNPMMRMNYLYLMIMMQILALLVALHGVHVNFIGHQQILIKSMKYVVTVGSAATVNKKKLERK